MPNQSSLSNHYSIYNLISFSNLYPSQYTFSLFLTTQTEIKTYNEASKFDCWKQAMKANLMPLTKMELWNLLTLHRMLNQ